jgi:hypothetical protein
MKTPRRKKTALLPKKEKTKFVSRISSAGRRMMAARLVAASGIGVKIQSVMQMVATPRHFIPALLNPDGGGRRMSNNPSRVKRSISPRLRSFISFPSRVPRLIPKMKIEVKHGLKHGRGIPPNVPKRAGEPLSGQATSVESLDYLGSSPRALMIFNPTG